MLAVRENAKMTVSARTDYPDGARENMNCTVRGEAETTDNVLRFIYDEPEAAEMGTVRTTVALAEDHVILTRVGAVRSEFRFALGAPHDSLYETGLASFPARVTTRALRIKRERRGALAEIRYALDVGGVTGEHRLKLLIRMEEES